MSRYWSVTAILGLGAVLLAVGLLQYREEFAVRYTGNRASQSIAADDPVITTGVEIDDAMCVADGGAVRAKGGSEPCDVASMGRTRGLFARGGVPRIVALIGGVVVPFLLLSICGFRIIRLLNGRTRIAAAVVLLAAGLTLLSPLVFIPVTAIENHVLTETLEALPKDYGRTPLPFLLLAGLALAIGGGWLAVRAWSGRKPA